MNIDDYQKSATETYQFKEPAGERDEGIVILLLGLTGEVGTLLSEYKKKIRDGENYNAFVDRAKEELGDILWYLSNVACQFKLRLSEIADQNLKKTQDRWCSMTESEKGALDENHPEKERFPRQSKFKIESVGMKTKIYLLKKNGDWKEIGDSLTDNAYEDDGYRFHDVFHLANMAVLGWSPVMRKLLKLKRKSCPTIDEVEDGARARIIEEAIAALIYNNAYDHYLYRNIDYIDTSLLDLVKKLTRKLEVKQCSSGNWEKAIFQGYSAFRHLQKNKKGEFSLNLDDKSLIILS